MLPSRKKKLLESIREIRRLLAADRVDGQYRKYAIDQELIKMESALLRHKKQADRKGKDI